MEPSKLSDHKFVKGKFITPINSLPQTSVLSDDESWTYGRLPEYIWIGLILDYYGRSVGFEKLHLIILKLREIMPDINTPRMSLILSAENEKQDGFYTYVNSIIVSCVLAPLTLLFPVSNYPQFAKHFYDANISVEDRKKILTKVMRELMFHQTEKATDIRFVVLFHIILSGKLQFTAHDIELFIQYPCLPHSDEKMKTIRPMVRSCEMFSMQLDKLSPDYIEYFWREVSTMTDCEIFYSSFDNEKREIGHYIDIVHNILQYISDLYQIVDPIDEKMTVITGLVTYAYKRLKEVVDHELYNSISGRSCVRTMIECYIMLKYLIKIENEHENVWRDYMIYGIGQYKLVLARHRENNPKLDSHFDMKYIEALVNEYQFEDFIDMDTNYFDKQNIRNKAIAVDEKDLWGLYYDYDSQFEHGLWGAIRENSLNKCNNPMHQYHCVPDIDDMISLKSVLPDCISVMNKIIELINDIYGIPEEKMNEVRDYEVDTYCQDHADSK